MDIAPNLFAPIKDPSKKKRLESLFDSFKSLHSEEDRKLALAKVQQLIQQDYAPSLGSHWHYLILKEAIVQLFSWTETPLPIQ